MKQKKGIQTITVAEVTKMAKRMLKPEICQQCKFHLNKPSRCTYDSVNTYVARKSIACNNFKR